MCAAPMQSSLLRSTPIGIRNIRVDPEISEVQRPASRDSRADAEAARSADRARGHGLHFRAHSGNFHGYASRGLLKFSRIRSGEASIARIARTGKRNVCSS